MLDFYQDPVVAGIAKMAAAGGQTLHNPSTHSERALRDGGNSSASTLPAEDARKELRKRAGKAALEWYLTRDTPGALGLTELARKHKATNRHAVYREIKRIATESDNIAFAHEFLPTAAAENSGT